MVELWDAVPKGAFIGLALLAVLLLTGAGWLISRLLR